MPWLCNITVAHVSPRQGTLTCRSAGKDSNWVPTNPSGQFELLFRFYGPDKPLFDKTWKLPDIERIAAQ